MKKIYIILSLCIILMSVQANAQKGYSLSPSNTYTEELPPGNLSVCYIYMNNITSGTIILKWEKISIDMPVGWDYALCDLGTCYAIIPDSAQMHDVEKDANGFLGFNVDPGTIGGEGTAQFYVYEAGKYNEGDTVSFILSAKNTGISLLAKDAGIQVYPNPISNVLNVASVNSNPMSVEILDISGHSVLNLTQDSNFKSIDVSGLSQGIYFIQFNVNNTVYHQKFVKL